MSKLINLLCKKWYEWTKLQQKYRNSNKVTDKRKYALLCEKTNEEVSNIVDKINEIFK